MSTTTSEGNTEKSTTPPPSQTPAEVKPKLTAGSFTMKILNGVALGTVIALIPGALLSELFKALLPVFPAGQYVLNTTTISNALLSVICGFLVAMQFKFTPIQTASVATATFLGSGVLKWNDGSMVLSGTGDIINVMVTSAIAVGIVLLLGNALKAYAILVIPALVLLLGGGLGMLTLGPVSKVTSGIGTVVSSFTTLQPVLMCILVSMVFSILIVTPVSSVAIALAISLSGVGAGAGNLGVCAAGFGLAIAGWKVNSLGTSLAHFIGSPKIQMANVLSKPKTMVPILANAAVLGIIAAIFNIQGTPMSAGFGFSGLIGPVNALNLASGGWSFLNIIIMLFAFVVAPIGLGIFFNWLFSKVIPLVKPENYKITFD